MDKLNLKINSTQENGKSNIIRNGSTDCDLPISNEHLKYKADNSKSSIASLNHVYTQNEQER